ncbi:MAG: HAD family phosphatase [Erysipelotrichaceae bacterium]|nr:HAD family phosphatase [Erysipelotrichaceae bacterium]
MIRNIIFDMGQVLVRFQPEVICERITKDKIMAKELAELIMGSKEWDKLDEGTLSFEEAEAVFVQRSPEFADQIHQVLAHFDEMIDPMDAMEKLVIDLKQRGYSLYVLSNVSERYWNLKKRIPALALFKNQVLSYAEKVNKPDQKIYEVLLNRYQLNPEECLFIDDKMENLAVPQKMGWTVHQYKTAEECRQFLREMNILQDSDE